MKKYLTIDGQKRILEELKHLTCRKREEIAEQLKYAVSLGDLRENSEYDAVVEEYKATENKIYELEKLLNDSIVYEKKNDGTVEIGSIVTIDTDDGLETYEIVGFNESNLLEDKISYNSPLAKALLGRKLNDSLMVESEYGSYNVVIMAIE